MYGKHFSTMYEGSMVGAGAHVFAVMGYVISHMQPDKEVGFQVMLNSKLLGPILGEPEERIDAAIAYLTSPDPETTHPDDEGRRLVQIGRFAYRVVNGKLYDEIKDREQLRRANRDYQRTYRLKHPEKRKSARKNGAKTGAQVHNESVAREARYLAAEERGASLEELDSIAAEGLPVDEARAALDALREEV